jgi:uncharacterized UPF0146 family protein
MTMLTRVAMCGLLLCAPVAAHAVDGGRSTPKLDIEVGAGLFCNSAAQVERYLALHIADSEPEQAIKKVNDEVRDPNACALAVIAFVRGEQSKSVEAPGGIMKVTEIVVVALQTSEGWQRVQPIRQYTAIFQKLDEV